MGEIIYQTQASTLLNSPVLVYFSAQQPAFFEEADDVLPVPDFAKACDLTLGELFGWLLE